MSKSERFGKLQYYKTAPLTTITLQKREDVPFQEVSTVGSQEKKETQSKTLSISQLSKEEDETHFEPSFLTADERSLNSEESEAKVLSFPHHEEVKKEAQVKQPKKSLWKVWWEKLTGN